MLLDNYSLGDANQANISLAQSVSALQRISLCLREKKMILFQVVITSPHRSEEESN